MNIGNALACIFFGIACGAAINEYAIHYNNRHTTAPVFSPGDPALVFNNGQPLYDGRVTGTTEDGKYVKVGDETTHQWPPGHTGLNYWRSAKDVRHLSPKQIDLIDLGKSPNTIEQHRAKVAKRKLDAITH